MNLKAIPPIIFLDIDGVMIAYHDSGTNGQ